MHGSQLRFLTPTEGLSDQDKRKTWAAFPDLVINRAGSYCLIISVTYEVRATDSQGIWRGSRWFEDKDIFLSQAIHVTEHLDPCTSLGMFIRLRSR